MCRPYAKVADILAVNIGAEILKIVPGRVSTEVDAHLSYDTRATVDKALRLVELYEKKGIDTRERVYIKIVRCRHACGGSQAAVPSRKTSSH